MACFKVDYYDCYVMGSFSILNSYQLFWTSYHLNCMIYFLYPIHYHLSNLNFQYLFSFFFYFSSFFSSLFLFISFLFTLLFSLVSHSSHYSFNLFEIAYLILENLSNYSIRISSNSSWDSSYCSSWGSFAFNSSLDFASLDFTSYHMGSSFTTFTFDSSLGSASSYSLGLFGCTITANMTIDSIHINLIASYKVQVFNLILSLHFLQIILKMMKKAFFFFFYPFSL